MLEHHHPHQQQQPQLPEPLHQPLKKVIFNLNIFNLL
jgi:hypothetical protein